MHEVIKFNENSKSWEKSNWEFNKIFVKSRIMYLYDLYGFQGYVYLNTIYESLEMKWDPNRDNICWIKERDGELKIEIDMISAEPNEILITIAYNQN